MADHSVPPDAIPPDYEFDETLELREAAQYRALFEDTRMQIISVLSERAATTAELSQVLDRPKGTIGHHLGVLADAGLVKVVRTKKVRAIEAKYYGRTARVFLYGHVAEGANAAERAMSTAASELAAVPTDHAGVLDGNIRHVRVPDARAQVFRDRLRDLLVEFAEEPRGGETTYALAFAVYPSSRPALPADEEIPADGGA